VQRHDCRGEPERHRQQQGSRVRRPSVGPSASSSVWVFSREDVRTRFLTDAVATPTLNGSIPKARRPLARGWQLVERHSGEADTTLSFTRLSFVNLVGAVLGVSVIVGVVGYAVFGTTTNKGTTGAIGAENAKIMAAERTSCSKYGKYATISRLQSEGLLTTKPTYNSVVYVPGRGCGTIVVGSAAYQAQAG